MKRGVNHWHAHTSVAREYTIQASNNQHPPSFSPGPESTIGEAGGHVSWQPLQANAAGSDGQHTADTAHHKGRLRHTVLQAGDQASNERDDGAAGQQVSHQEEAQHSKPTGGDNHQRNVEEDDSQPRIAAAGAPEHGQPGQLQLPTSPAALTATQGKYISAMQLSKE